MQIQFIHVESETSLNIKLWFKIGNAAKETQLLQTLDDQILKLKSFKTLNSVSLSVHCPRGFRLVINSRI